MSSIPSEGRFALFTRLLKKALFLTSFTNVILLRRLQCLQGRCLPRPDGCVLTTQGWSSAYYAYNT
eukprot:6476562-Amphidinium_carterae.3